MRSTRRDFLKALGFGAAAISVPGLARAGVPPPSELLDSAPFALAEDQALIHGTGVKAPAGSFTADDVLALNGELHKGYDPVYFMNERTFWHLRDPDRLDPANPRRRSWFGRLFGKRTADSRNSSSFSDGFPPGSTRWTPEPARRRNGRRNRTRLAKLKTGRQFAPETANTLKPLRTRGPSRYLRTGSRFSREPGNRLFAGRTAGPSRSFGSVDDFARKALDGIFGA